jgi:hypothetical protein
LLRSRLRELRNPVILRPKGVLQCLQPTLNTLLALGLGGQGGGFGLRARLRRGRER